MPFDRYYPEAFRAGTSASSYAFLSKSFQRFLFPCGDPSVPAELSSRYDDLMTRQASGPLTADEEDELYELQAEMDGMEYASQVGGESWIEEFERSQREAEATVGILADRAIRLTEGAPSRHEN